MLLCLQYQVALWYEIDTSDEVIYLDICASRYLEVYFETSFYHLAEGTSFDTTK